MIVKIESPNISIGKPSTGMGTILETAEGHAIHGVKRAVVTFAPDQAVKADIEVYAAVKTSALAEFSMVDPLAGQKKTVKRIEFCDGTFFQP